MNASILKTNPLVAIKCTVYNHEKFIRDALEGFVMQKTNFPFVAIVHDDASIDNSAKIIQEYAEKYPDIIKPIFETENQYSKHDGSLRRIMNEAVEATGAKYIAMCEGDDYWIDPLKLQKQVDFLDGNPEYSMCFHNAVVLNERNKLTFRITSFSNLNKDCDVTIDQLIGNWIVPTASILYKKECNLDKNQINIQIHSGDMKLILTCFAIGPVRYLDKYMSVYRLNQGGVSNAFNVEKNNEQLSKLYQAFDKFTHEKYHSIIETEINERKQNSKFYKLRKKSLLLTLLIMPKYSYKRIMDKLSRFRQS